MHHLPDLRAAIYSIPTEVPADGEEASVGLAMQRLFWSLQNSRKAQSTRDLLASFGWDSSDTLMQQDISDFCHMLFDILEEGMKNTTADGAIPGLMAAKLQYTDAAPAVGWEKHREDSSYVTVLHGVKDGECKNVMESLELLCQPQVIEDYDTEVHGKQTVSRSLRFKETPPLLLLNINRIDFCHETFEPIKLNERYEFPEELDLANVVLKDENDDEGTRPPTKYSLRAVIVHMGTAQMGHYISYCRLRRPASKAPADGAGLQESRVTPNMFGRAGADSGTEGEQKGAEDDRDDGMQWYCFDDDHVYPVSKEEAVDGNFGSGAGSAGGAAAGMMGMGGPTRGMIERMKASRSAYMLCYLRHDCLEPEHTAKLAEALQNVPEHVKDAEVHGARSLPVSLSLLIPPVSVAGAGPERTIAAAGAGGNEEPKGEGNAALVRGSPIEITVSNVEERSVQDLLEQSAQAASAKGQLVRPSADLFQAGEVERMPDVQANAPAPAAGAALEAVVEVGGDTGLGTLSEPQIALALTAVGKHMIVNIYRNETPAMQIDPSFLLRAEWVDTQPLARHVAVMHLEPAVVEQGGGGQQNETNSKEQAPGSGETSGVGAERGARDVVTETTTGDRDRGGAAQDAEGKSDGTTAKSYKHFGDPFVFSVYLDETVGSARRRLLL